MAKKGKQTHSEPKYPYTNVPGVLRKILQAIPTKPKPAKLDAKLAVSWGCSKAISNNLRSAVAVLKRIGMIGSAGGPNPLYVDFMNKTTGPAALGARLREVYKEIFNAAHAPQSESDETLEGLFNVHAGGSEQLVRLQMQTFKAVCEFATFDGTPARATGTASGSCDGGSGAAGGADGGGIALPPVKVDLHIHLPENKSSRDYEAIIQDIAKYIYGRGSNASG